MMFLDLIGRTGFKLAASGAVVVTLVTMCSMRDKRIETRGAEKVASAIAKDAEKTRAKANAARAAARAPGAVDRLRQSKIDCRDC